MYYIKLIIRLMCYIFLILMMYYVYLDIKPYLREITTILLTFIIVCIIFMIIEWAFDDK